MPYTYDYSRPALTVDCVVFGLDEEDLKVVLIQRDLDPFAGKWALPGDSSTWTSPWKMPHGGNCKRRRAYQRSFLSSFTPSAT